MILRAFGFRALFHILLYITFSFFTVPDAHALIIPVKQQTNHQLISDKSTATDTFESPPTTTPPPIANELLKRQYGTPTCGFISGDINYPYKCGLDQRCVTNSLVSLVFCCPTSIALSNCIPGNTCLDSAVHASLTQHGYGIGQHTVACTNPGYSYCNKIIFAGTATPAGYSAFWCGAVSNVNPFRAYATPTDGGGGNMPSPTPSPTPNPTPSPTPSPTPTPTPSPRTPTPSPTPDEDLPTSISRSRSSTYSTDTPTFTNPTLQVKISDKTSGLTTADKIALGVGIPCGLVAVGSIIGWLIKTCSTPPSKS